MTKLKSCAALVLLLPFAFVSFADEHAAMEKPSFYASSTTLVTATVEAINHETREVTLRRADGEVINFTASEEARNLDQVAVGDVVQAEHVQSLSIEVVENDGSEPGEGKVAALGRTEKGEMPGMAAIESQVTTATVEEINIEANTFKLKGPDGSVNEFTARNPENLKRAAVGDLVVFTVTEAIAISVEKGAPE